MLFRSDSSTEDYKASVFERTIEVFDWVLRQSFTDTKIESEVRELKFEFQKMLSSH